MPTKTYKCDKILNTSSQSKLESHMSTPKLSTQKSRVDPLTRIRQCAFLTYSIPLVDQLLAVEVHNLTRAALSFFGLTTSVPTLAGGGKGENAESP